MLVDWTFSYGEIHLKFTIALHTSLHYHEVKMLSKET